MSQKEILTIIAAISFCIAILGWWFAGLKVHESQRSQRVHMTHLYK